MKSTIKMRIFLSAVTLFCMCALFFAGGAAASPPAHLVPDPVLRACINEQLGRPPDTPIGKEELESLTELSCIADCENSRAVPRVRSLEGLQYAVNLRSLEIHCGDLSHPDAVAAIRDLTRLEALELNYCKLRADSLAHIARLAGLKLLSLRFNDIGTFETLRPLFAVKLEQSRVNPAADQFDFYADGAVNDFSGLEDYFQMKKEYLLKNSNAGELEAEQKAVYYITRGMTPDLRTLRESQQPGFVGSWGQTYDPIETGGPVSPDSSSGMVTVKENITDMFGEKALFCAPGDWRDDREHPGDASFLESAGIDLLLFPEPLETYFTLKERENKEHPGEMEAYYEGRDFNLAPYNPYARGADDRQHPVKMESGEDVTVFSYEFKTDSATASVIVTGFPFFLKTSSIGYNGGQPAAFRQIIAPLDEKDPAKDAPPEKADPEERPEIPRTGADGIGAPAYILMMLCGVVTALTRKRKFRKS